MTYFWPTQTLEPVAKGTKYAFIIFRVSSSASSHRLGSKRPGFGNAVGSLCIQKVVIKMGV